MKHTSLVKRSILPATLVATLAAAQPVKLETPSDDPLNRFAASFRAAFNAMVDFKNVGMLAPQPGARLTPDGDPFNYEDGYVLTDSSGNLMGYTRYWGYDYDSGPFNQLPGDGTLVMHTSSSAGVSKSANDDGPFLGFELTYQRELGRNEKMRWGLEGAFNYMNVSAHDSRPLSVGVSRVGTPYLLPALEGGGFVSPPPAPYAHGADLSPEGNPVITADPGTPITTTIVASMSGARKFDADVFGFRLGPYLEVPLGEKWMVSVSGGLSLAQVNSDFSYTEALAWTGVAAASGSGSHHDLLVGGYVAGNVNYKLNKDWGLFGGVQYQNVGKYNHTENGRKAVLDLSQTIFVVVGANYSF